MWDKWDQETTEMIQRITLLRCDRSVIEETLWFNEKDRYIGTNTGAMPFTLLVQSSVNVNNSTRYQYQSQ